MQARQRLRFIVWGLDLTRAREVHVTESSELCIGFLAVLKESHTDSLTALHEVYEISVCENRTILWCFFRISQGRGGPRDNEWGITGPPPRAPLTFVTRQAPNDFELEAVCWLWNGGGRNDGILGLRFKPPTLPCWDHQDLLLCSPSSKGQIGI